MLPIASLRTSRTGEDLRLYLANAQMCFPLPDTAACATVFCITVSLAPYSTFPLLFFHTPHRLALPSYHSIVTTLTNIALTERLRI